MEKTRLRNLLLFIVFGVMLFSQPTQLLSQIDLSQTNESTISSASYTTDISASHLTSPTTIPNYHEWKADPALFPQAEKIVSLIPPVLDPFLFPLGITEATGFLDAIKYQSNYLP
ncbi:hypothetical protein JOC34_003972 [Virgibacillus halotolerans]|uniref:hypothetical protein n=1 Tax=Virgibacillus halotolerans TaxID=1071053 RepID=UPI0019606773|nr:hypothetical protein [Virgibacillus halotolerans]MBM7601547.1 hypothetical protein [Virgibacillus halotolerans]